MPLPLFHQHLHNIQLQHRWLGELNAIGRRRPRLGLSNTQRVFVPNRNDLGDWRLTIQDGDGLAAAYCAEAFARS